MSRWLRFVIVCIVAMALPVQGIAGAAMVHCGSTPHGLQRADLESAAHAAAEHAAAGSHEAAAPDELEGLGKCSACASCCSACAIVSALPRVPVPEFSAAVFAVVVPVVEAMAADGPERPPRIGLA